MKNNFMLEDKKVIEPKEEMISYNHRNGDGSYRFRQLKKDKLPEWAVDVKPCSDSNI